MLAVRVGILAVDKNIVKVYDDKLVKHVTEVVVHEMLKGCWRICKTKRHYLILIEAISSAEGRFPFITFLDAKQVVGASQVNLGEDLC